MIELVTRNLQGRPSNDTIAGAAITGDGRYVDFYWRIADLVTLPPGNATGLPYVRDLKTGTTQMVATGPDGQPIVDGRYSYWLSGDRRWIAIKTDSPAWLPAWVNTLPPALRQSVVSQFTVFRNQLTGQTQTVRNPTVLYLGKTVHYWGGPIALDAHGRYALMSLSVPIPGGLGSRSRLAVLDRVTERWRMLTDLSPPDGQTIYFPEQTDNTHRYLVYGRLGALGDLHYFLMDLTTMTSRPLDNLGVLSRDGRSLFTTRFAHPGNVLETVVEVRDTATLTLRQTTRYHHGEGVAATDLTGRRVVLYVREPNGNPMFPGQYYLLDRATGTRTLITHAMDGGPSRGGHGGVWPNSLSDNGRVVVFGTFASNLVPHDLYDPTFSGSWDSFTATFPSPSS